MNLADIVQAVDRRAGIAYDRDATVEVVNEALQAISTERDWPWLQTSWSFTTDGDATFTPPATWGKVRSVTVAGRPWPMLPIQQIDGDELLNGWSVEGGELVLYPTPTSGLAVVARIYRTEPALDDDADEPLMPAEWHRGLVDYAAAIIFERVGDLPRADRCRARFEAVRTQMTQQSNRVKGPHRVRVRPGSLL